MRNTFFLSAIYLIDELPHIHRLPWQISVDSTLAFADELIVVHGGHTDSSGRRPVWNAMHARRDDRIRLFTFPWPDEFDWRQIGLSCAFGLAKATGTWAFRVLADEVFPGEFRNIASRLRDLPPEIRQVIVRRDYMLGSFYACPALEKPLFFRNDGSQGYGGINILQGPEAMPALFDDPIDTDHWFDGREVVSIRERSIVRSPDCEKRLLRGELPQGYRDLTGMHDVKLDIGMLNVDVCFFEDREISEQKRRSYRAYDRLPAGSLPRTHPQGEEILDVLRRRVEDMIRGPLIRPSVPEELMSFFDENDAVHNCVRDVCAGRFGIPWNRLSLKPRSLRGWMRWLCHLPVIEARRVLRTWMTRYRAQK